tara:strand:+ start:1732 stop:2007 length:276 start_codon:yes stop_codon:yes gene_type:complete
MIKRTESGATTKVIDDQQQILYVEWVAPSFDDMENVLDISLAVAVVVTWTTRCTADIFTEGVLIEVAASVVAQMLFILIAAAIGEAAGAIG